MSDWQEIESAPKDRTHVLICADSFYDNHDAVVGEAYWEIDEGHEGWFWTGFHWTDPTDGSVGMNVTHWMPLPDPPLTKRSER